MMEENNEQMTVVYLAHPVSGDVPGNLAEARLWVRHLETTNPNVAIVATWITECEIFDDSVPEERAAGFRRNFAILERCDEIWLVGTHVSPGMKREKDFAQSKGIPCTNMTAIPREARPDVVTL